MCFSFPLFHRWRSSRRLSVPFCSHDWARCLVLFLLLFPLYYSSNLILWLLLPSLRTITSGKKGHFSQVLIVSSNFTELLLTIALACFFSFSFKVKGGQKTKQDKTKKKYKPSLTGEISGGLLRKCRYVATLPRNEEPDAEALGTVIYHYQHKVAWSVI